MTLRRAAWILVGLAAWVLFGERLRLAYFAGLALAVVGAGLLVRASLGFDAGGVRGDGGEGAAELRVYFLEPVAVAGDPDDVRAVRG